MAHSSGCSRQQTSYLVPCSQSQKLKREKEKNIQWSKQHENVSLLYQIKQEKSLMPCFFCTSLNPRLVVSTQRVCTAGAFEAVLLLFLTLISFIFGSDHTTQKTLGVSQEQTKLKKYLCLTGKEPRQWSLTNCHDKRGHYAQVVQVMAAGVNANLPLNMRIRRGTAIFMNQWMSSAVTDTTTDFKSPTDTAPQ